MSSPPEAPPGDSTDDSPSATNPPSAMKTIRRAANASGTMAASMMVVTVCRFVRNLILARLLLPEDFGVGATFTLTLTFLELLTELGPAKQLVQAKEGALASWQGVAHSILVVRGLLMGGVILACAPWIASGLGVPEATSAFRLLALAPLLKGFEHLDYCRFQRDLLLGRLALVEAAPVLVSLAIAPLAAIWLGDYRAFLVVTLVSVIGRVVLSHVVATRPYALRADRGPLQRFVNFGWPLIGNSLILFFVLHGERVLVASCFDLATLGAYSVALTIGFMPAMMLARLHGSVALPVFSRTREDAVEFRKAVASSAQLVCLAAGLMAIVFLTAGSWLVGTLYGEKYLITQQVIPWIGLMCAARVVRCTPSMMAIALGDTRIPLYSNVARLAGFAAAAGLLVSGFDVAWAAICGFAGELTAYGLSLALLKLRHDAPVDESLRCVLGVTIAVGAVAILANYAQPALQAGSPLIAAVAAATFIGLALSCWPNLRAMLRVVLDSRRRSQTP